MGVVKRERGSDTVLVGKVVSVNFSRRQLRVLPETDHPERFLGMRQVTLETTAGKFSELDVDRVELLGNKAVMTLSARYDAEEIAAAKNALVVVREDERYQLDEDEHYVDDLIGMQVVDASGCVLGRLHEVYRTGANDVYEVVREGRRELLVPAVKERILNVDVANRVLTLDAEGLLESTDEN